MRTDEHGFRLENFVLGYTMRDGRFLVFRNSAAEQVSVPVICHPFCSRCCDGGARFGPEPKDAADPPGFVPAMVVAEAGPTPCPVAPASSGGSIEIEFAAGARMRITGAVDAATPKAAVAALADGRLR
ncbi:hypothetical protein [Bradyrhizobium sp. CCBAU 21359]|uniref:hypothetical protein n=1 Tax=Bradyrhizobium sp. CCBAU 21359 TaxID=1325080 RepID=UPI002306B860|nr:hypothetical protein [Bradyrhizobium sp. CCBAU 21359]